MTYSKRPRKTPVRISIEGNIATGKSTFVKLLTEAAVAEDWEVTQEPVAQWTKVEGKEGDSKTGNLLQLFYSDPKRWAYTFQSFALISRMKHEREHFGSNVSAQLSERSIHSDRYIFARNCYETGLMTETEWLTYKEWSDYLVNSLGELHLDGFIYLRADPDISCKRMAKRNRPEETSVTIEYLSRIHEKHEAWLHRRDYNDENIMTDIPILEIDCNKDFEDDEVIQQRMLQQVRDFVKQLQTIRRNKVEEKVTKTAGLHDDSGLESRSISPASLHSVSPIPFADIKTDSAESEQPQTASS